MFNSFLFTFLNIFQLNTKVWKQELWRAWWLVPCHVWGNEWWKWPDKCNSGDWFLYQDCAPRNSALSEPDFLPRNKMTIVTCPLYSFHLVPHDFLFVPELKVALKGRWCHNDSRKIGGYFCEFQTVQFTKRFEWLCDHCINCH